ncbi:hypothetical protein FPZ45_13320 [Cohnella terricola]|uniref:Uncharacterized protein n=1 Tax=Cohnella terricola TaxID=1289167 RepID=A0A559JJ49_9BACL|nr:hypothetical protein FPZ45_13320 [Cohnella terricola]
MESRSYVGISHALFRCVVLQAMARDFGKERMQEWVNRADYGSKDFSGGIDRLWLNSSLKISPVKDV